MDRLAALLAALPLSAFPLLSDYPEPLVFFRGCVLCASSSWKFSRKDLWSYFEEEPQIFPAGLDWASFYLAQQPFTCVFRYDLMSNCCHVGSAAAQVGPIDPLIWWCPLRDCYRNHRLTHAELIDPLVLPCHTHTLGRVQLQSTSSTQIFLEVRRALPVDQQLLS